ncbi:MAG: ATP-binding protein [Sulfuricurvum sp.]|uniref:ATP-binding protein n=1 Tax=Sulfuricurvum sp. TaxID=2025608 RepID=UPI0025F6D04D|nr:ATP-binding protein [Sulfuricurvum sp.]MCK9371577.1 ATP-binding protein [Sulfuricurvum sp.]
MVEWSRTRVVSFIALYVVLMAAVTMILYSRYETQNRTYIEAHVREFDQRMEEYQSMQGKMIDSYYALFLERPEITAIMEEAVHADPSRQAVLRQKLRTLTEATYRSLKNFDVRILFFHLPDQIAFLRLHKPEKFGDSLSLARPSIVIAQKTKKKTAAFETGKVFDGFRTIYPLFHHRKFVGTVEVAYPFVALKKQAMRQNPGAYTFVIKRSLQESKATTTQIGEYYRDSPFGSAYFEDKESALEKGATGFERGELKGFLENNRERIQKGVGEEKLQGLKLYYQGNYSLLILKPVHEIGDNQAAYMVEFSSDHTFFADTVRQLIELLIIIAVLLAMLMWYIYRYNRSTLVLEQYKKAIDENMIVSKTDHKGIVTYVNPRFVEISGYTEGELIGKSHTLIRHPDAPGTLFKELWTMIQKGKIWHGALQNRAKNGQSYYVNITICPIVDEKGKILEFIGLGEDVTLLVETTKREERLRQEAQRSEMAKMEFLANMSHEIRTPLNGIMGFAKLLSDANLPHENHRQAVIIADQSKTLMGVINDILDLSKIESGNLLLEKVVINPFVEFENAFSLFLPIAHEKGVDYRVRLDSTLNESINIDILRLKQVMGNLISNALKFTKAGGSVTVEVSKITLPSEKERLRFSVQDSGIGIAPEKLSAIFTPFTQEDSSTTRQFGGTGLGLSISSKLVELFGGRLRVESQKGVGSRFWFDLEVEESDPREVIAAKFAPFKVGIIRSSSPQHEPLKRQLEGFGLPYRECDENGLDAQVRDDACDVIITFEESAVDRFVAAAEKSFSHIVLIGSSKRNYPEYVRTIQDYDNCPSRLYNTLLSIGVGGVRSVSYERGVKQWKNRRILVAEDYEVNRILIEALLEIHAITPDFAVNGEEACLLIEKNRYDLVFMDVNMPIMDGIEATRMIRQNHPDIPIIALTANALKGDRERFLSAGMSDYLSKPIDPNLLVETLERFLGKASIEISSASGMDEKEESLYADTKERLNLPDTVLVRVFDLFESSTPARLKALEEAIDRLDFEEIKTQAHTIKGAAGNLRLSTLSDIAALIEEYALNREAAPYGSLFEELRESFEDFRHKHARQREFLV